MKFYLINNTTWPVPEAFLKWLLKHLCQELKKIKKHQKLLKKNLGIVLIEKQNMRELNKKYRKKNKITDVLSFAGDDDFLGDIVLCSSQVQKQAKEHKLDPSEELAYLVLHGLLHLLGYDHEASATEAKKMFRLQDKLFADLQDRDILKAFKKTGLNGKKAQLSNTLQ